MNKLINEIVQYGMKSGLVKAEDRIYTINRLLELFNIYEFEEEVVLADRPLCEILEDMLEYAVREGLLEDTVTQRDLFDTKIMGLLTPPPSVVRNEFALKALKSAKEATDYYYSFSKATNYIRTDRIVKDEKWVTDSEYGPIDITINLSKPEKDPKDIAKAGQAKKSGYPSCLLCCENEGYSGYMTHPARQNHRIIPMELAGENYFLQYSPYVYYNEHCIIFNEKHTPMKINRGTFYKLLDFVRQFPHYMAGSNADLPIVGGSILSHDHFQGGNYEFAMAKAGVEYEFEMKDYSEVKAGIVKWPMSVIRLTGEDINQVTDAAEHILNKWRSYTDADAYIYCETDNVLHNTITPIARMRNGQLEIDLVLRNNITTEERPWGLYHPSEDLHHIKKENIGLIEVMGLAILPARLKKEMVALEDAILNKKDLRADEMLAKHADWAESFTDKYEFTRENIHGHLQQEIGKVFVKVLECAGVYKRDEAGIEAFKKFTSIL